MLKIETHFAFCKNKNFKQFSHTVWHLSERLKPFQHFSVGQKNETLFAPYQKKRNILHFVDGK